MSLANIDREIASLENAMYPRFHQVNVGCVHFLADLRWERSRLSRDKKDLHKSIVHRTEAILLLSVSRDRPYFKNIFLLLFDLASSLSQRSVVYNQPADSTYAIEYLQYLRGLPVDSSHVDRISITTMLIMALAEAIRVESDGVHNIDEMLVLFRELPKSGLAGDLFLVFISLDVALKAEHNRGRFESLDAVIEYLRDAMKIYSSDSLIVLYTLAGALHTRFILTHSSADYEESMTLYERVTDASQPGECPDYIRDLASLGATFVASDRSTLFKNPEYSEATISRLRTELGSSGIDRERCRVELANNLALLVNDRSEQYNLPESLEEAKSYASQVVDLSSSESWRKLRYFPTGPVLQLCSIALMTEKIQRLEELLSNTPLGTDDHYRCLDHLASWYAAKFDRTDEISDLEESIKYYRLQLEAVHQLISPLISLQPLLFRAFVMTRKIDYLEDSIAAGYEILESKSARVNHFEAVDSLVMSLVFRDHMFAGGKKGKDFNDAIRLMSTVIDDPYARDSDRFRLSCQWAFMARHIDHPTTLTAYKTAMSLIQKILSFAPTVSTQHSHLVALNWWCCKTFPLDYASFHIVFGRFEEAVETLEQGRAILWSEMRGFRAPVAQLIVDDSPLAKRFAEINRELEALTVSITPSGRPEMEDGDAQGGDGTDPFGRLVIKRRKLMEERDALVSQIRGLPGFEGFLKAPSFDTLRSATSHGPVILINHCHRRSDILIVFHNRLTCSIPTAHDFYARANTLRDELVEARKHGLDSREYQDALCSVLKDLYELVGESVIKTLQVSGVPEQSRIWWCPTSVFCSLPLHAMGPIPSSDSSKPRYFSDLYIPSYTPSLSALIESRRANSQIQDKPSLLLVAQPEDSLPDVKGEIKVIKRAADKARVTVASLVSSKSTPSSVIEGLRSSRFAHFACHGVLETGKPFEASFKLYADSRLTLLDIVRSRLPDAEFAFLSCCHAAEITKDSIEDEALHLTAAMQYCGFRSVVGTMWAMADTDGRDLAKSFYKSLFSSQETDVPYYERSAYALRDATQKLRRKRGIRLERWVNFVHYGA